MTTTTGRTPAGPQRNPAATTVELTRSVRVAGGQEEVFDLVSDFTRAHEWRTEVVESAMSPDGPMRRGSRLREVAVVAGRRVVTDSVIEVFARPHRFTFEHVRGPLPVSGEYRVEPDGTGASIVRYTLRVRLVGGWRWLAPLLRLTAPRTVDGSLRALAHVVAATASTDRRP